VGRLLRDLDGEEKGGAENEGALYVVHGRCRHPRRRYDRRTARCLGGGAYFQSRRAGTTESSNLHTVITPETRPPLKRMPSRSRPAVGSGNPQFNQIRRTHGRQTLSDKLWFHPEQPIAIPTLWTFYLCSLSFPRSQPDYSPPGADFPYPLASPPPPPPTPFVPVLGGNGVQRRAPMPDHRPAA